MKKLLAFLLLLLLPTLALAQAEIELPGIALREVQVLSAGGFLCAGISASEETGEETPLVLLRLDADGTELWRQAYDAIPPALFLDVLPLPAEGAIALLMEHDLDAIAANNEFPVYTRLLLADGQPPQAQNIPVSDVGLDVQLYALADGYLLFFPGTHRDTAKADIAPVMQCFDLQGGARWETTFAQDGLEVYGIYPVAEGLLVYGAMASAEGTENQRDALVMLLDAEGGVRWQQTRSGVFSKYFREAALTPEGNLLLLGEHHLLPPYDSRTEALSTLSCLSPEGQWLWEQEYDPSAPFHSLHSLLSAAEGVLVLSQAHSVLRIDAQGTLSEVWAGDLPGDFEHLSLQRAGAEALLVGMSGDDHTGTSRVFWQSIPE